MIELNEPEIEIESTSKSIIEKAAEAEAAGASSFMRPEPKKVKGQRGRPPGKKSEIKKDAGTATGTATSKSSTASKDENTGPVIETKALCYPIVRGISHLGVQATKIPQAQMNPAEIEDMANALGMVLDKYMPDAMKNYGPELALGFAMGQYGLRLYALVKIHEDMARKRQPQPAEPLKRDEASTPSVKNDIEMMSDTVIP